MNQNWSFLPDSEWLNLPGANIINGSFNFSKRKEDLLNQIFDYFKFDTQCLGLTLYDVQQYFSLLDQISINSNLTNLLMETGRNFKATLFNDPKYLDLKQDFLTLHIE